MNVKFDYILGLLRLDDTPAAGTYVPTTTTITIASGTGISVTGGTQDLSTNRTWTVNLSVPVTVANGGTGLTSIAAGSILAANSANVLTAVTHGSGIGTFQLQNTSGTISWQLVPSLTQGYTSITDGTNIATAGSTTMRITFNGGTSTTATLSGAGTGTHTIVFDTTQNLTTSGSPTFTAVTATTVNSTNFIATGQYEMAAGSAGTPSLAFSDNLDTGIFEQATGSSGNMAFSVNGVETLRMNSVQQWGWHGTAGSAASVHTMTYTATGLSTGAFMNFSFTTPASLPAFIATLNFTGTTQTSKDIRNIQSYAVASFSGNYTNTLRSFYAITTFSNAITLSSGTAQMIGYDFAPSSGTSANYTGGTIKIIGLQTPTTPSGYTGSGSTLLYYAVLANGGYISMGGASGNTLQYTNNTGAPGTTATPVFTSFYGGNTIAMGNPVGWIIANIAGADQKIPYY